MIVVSDTSAIANLIVVGYGDLLPQLFGTVVVPTVVYQELLENGANHPVTQTVKTVNWLAVRTVQALSEAERLERERRFDPGEANAIVLAIELQATQLLIDERLGRIEAKRQGLRITGVIGILLVAKRQGLIADVRPILDALIDEANFRMSRRLYDETLVLAGETVSN